MGLLKTAAKVAVASSVHGRVQRRQQQRWAAQDATPDASAFPVGMVPAPPAPPAPPAAAGAPAIEAQLALIAQLNGLREAGALTDAEFEAKKAQILGL